MSYLMGYRLLHDDKARVWGVAMAGNKQKLKLLVLYKMFIEETDAKKGMSMPDIVQYLYERGIQAERKSLYRDIQVLRDFGLDIQKYERAPVQYALATRQFETQELMLIVDAVQSSKFLTNTTATNLVRKIRKLASNREYKLLDKKVNVHGRPRTQAQSDFNNVDLIQKAISEKKKISFFYFKYNNNLDRVVQHEGREYILTPVCLIYSEDNYYMVGWSDHYEDFSNYRVDRMSDITVLDERATKNEAISTYDADDIANRAFGMFTGERITAQLLVHSSMMSTVVDKFGDRFPCFPVDDEWAEVQLPVMSSPVFYGWLTEMGKAVRIQSPACLVEGYRTFLQEILDCYDVADTEAIAETTPETSRVGIE